MSVVCLDFTCFSLCLSSYPFTCLFCYPLYLTLSNPGRFVAYLLFITYHFLLSTSPLASSLLFSSLPLHLELNRSMGCSCFGNWPTVRKITTFQETVKALLNILLYTSMSKSIFHIVLHEASINRSTGSKPNADRPANRTKSDENKLLSSPGWIDQALYNCIHNPRNGLKKGNRERGARHLIHVGHLLS